MSDLIEFILFCFVLAFIFFPKDLGSHIGKLIYSAKSEIHSCEK